MQGFPLLSFLTWLPIAGGLRRAGVRRSRHQGRALGGARHRRGHVRRLDSAVHAASMSRRFDFQFVEQLPWIPAFHATYSLGCRRHLAAADPADDVHHHPGGRRRVDGDRAAPGAVLRRVPHHGRPDDRRVLRARRPAVLLLLGSDAHPDVPHHRRVGRSAARVRHAQVLPVHVPRLRVHAGRAHLHGDEDRRLQHRRRSTSCR